jgi:hypothetical protein
MSHDGMDLLKTLFEIAVFSIAAVATCMLVMAFH